MSAPSQPGIRRAAARLLLLLQPGSLLAQAPAVVGPTIPSYNLHVVVDEVSLTFHAADGHGLRLRDLQLSDLHLLDNGQPPRRVVSFEALEDIPIRAGILMDHSESMEAHRSGNRAIASAYAQRLLRQRTDQAFVVDFARLSKVVQPWTSDPATLGSAIRLAVPTELTRGKGTALYDAVYQSCRFQFGRIDHAASGNFLLLFTDGEDNASQASLQQAIDACQLSNTAVYAFRAESDSSFFSAGPKALADLAQQTGGRTFYGDDSPAQVDGDLRLIEADLRNRYRLVYRPAELRHDGSFHHIQLNATDLADTITVRSGYYAPSR